MTACLVFSRTWDYLDRIKVPNVPNYHFVCVINCEDKWTILDHIDADDRVLVASKSAQVCISKQVLWTPYIGKDLKACRDYHATEILHVLHLSDSSDMLTSETSQSLSIFEVVEDDCTVKRACCHTKGAQNFDAIRDHV